ncbi:ferritin-like domain-containing protein [Candidatus Hodarchaeum mangrovi]
MEKLEFYQNQIILEESIMKAATVSLTVVENKVITELIKSITMDSKKHISILNALIALNSETSGIKMISEEIRDELKKKIDHHLQLEKKAIDTYQEMWEQLENEKEKLLIKTILNDEIRHHELLLKIYQFIIQDVTLKDEDVFQIIWDDIKPEF